MVAHRLLVLAFLLGGCGAHESGPTTPPSQPLVVSDGDGDGIANDLDMCAEHEEDLDGYQDEDGCPDTDNDADGMADADDRCPNDPETYNGDEDEDGCPDRPICIVEDAP